MRVDASVDMTLTSQEQEYIKNDILSVKEAFENMINEKYIKLTSSISGDDRMNLADTVSLMLSDDWKDRFIAEYLQVKIRYNKLHKLIIKREVGKLDFKTPISLNSWKEQAHHMGLYLFELEKQAAIHGIELP